MKMGDVTDRMSSLPRNHRGVTPRADLAAGSSGAVDLKSVLKDVEQLPGSSMFSAKEVDEIMQSTARIVADLNLHWTIILNALKNFRSLCADTDHHNEIVAFLRHLTPPLQGAVKDLRSQICREACLTVAYIAYQLGMKSEFFLEPLMPTLFSLLVANANNAQVVTITGSGTIWLVYEYVPSFRLIPPLLVQMNQSKAKEVRRAVCSVLKIILTKWPQTTMQRQAIPLQEIIKKGLTDADADARTSTREAFPVFQQIFPGLAQSILDTLGFKLRLQNEEIKQHYSGNRTRNALVREDTSKAKEEQRIEEQRALEERLRQLQLLQLQADEDARLAKELAERFESGLEDGSLANSIVRAASIKNNFDPSGFVNDVPTSSSYALLPQATKIKNNLQERSPPSRQDSNNTSPGSSSSCGSERKMKSIMKPAGTYRDKEDNIDWSSLGACGYSGAPAARHYQSLFYYLSTFLVQFLLLSMMLKALTIYSVLLVGTSWVLLWSTYGFLVWHKGLSIFEEWTRAFAQVLGNITISDFSSEPKLVSKNLIPVYALSSVGLLSLQLLNAPPVLVIILGLFNCFGIIRGVKNYRIRWKTSFMIISTVCTSSFIVSGCLQQLSAIPEEDLASANEILSVAMLALKRTLEEYVGILPAISLHVTVAVVNLAIMAESYLQTRQVTNVLEQLVLYAWFAKSVYLLPSITASGFCCLLSVAIVLGTLFYHLDANKGLWTIFVGTFTSLLFVILVIISVELISRAAKEEAGVVKSLSWKEYSENCHRKAWESMSLAQTRIECSRKYERVPTWVSWTGKVSSVKVISVEPLFADRIQDEISFEVLVSVASSPWEVDSDAGGAWNLLSGAGKEKELLSIVSVTVSTKDIIGSEGKMEAVNRLLSLNPGDVVRVQGLLRNGAGSLKPEIGRVNLSRCHYCEDNADTEEIFMPTESVCSRLLGGLEEYLGSELLAILGEAEFNVRHYLNATLNQI